uniref:Cytohesin 4a n=1 Tax=Gadus morhua TaxID=8049 RepID=A0A8C5A9P2_GADMO
MLAGGRSHSEQTQSRKSELNQTCTLFWRSSQLQAILSGVSECIFSSEKSSWGICYLVENNFLEWRAESVAEFIYKEEGLNKTAIGNFLGEREDMHIEVLKAFVNLHQFFHLNLVQALRQFLWSFRLPGEAQKIDRMMEAFAARYCDCNAGVFQSTDTCYILSFSIIMLNTSLHNPSVKDKPDLRRFFIMNRGIDHGDDLSAELLTKLYESISKEPFKIPEDDGNDLTLTFFNPDREGWLLKRGGRVKTWKRRWFILTDSCLYYFQYTSDKDPIGIIPLENLSVRPIHDPTKRYCLELSSCGGQKVKACKVEAGGLVEGKHRAYRLSAASRAEQDGWVASIRSSISKDPFYDLVTSRRRKVTGSINSSNNNRSTQGPRSEPQS